MTASGLRALVVTAGDICSLDFNRLSPSVGRPSKDSWLAVRLQHPVFPPQTRQAGVCAARSCATAAIAPRPFTVSPGGRRTPCRLPRPRPASPAGRRRARHPDQAEIPVVIARRRALPARGRKMRSRENRRATGQTYWIGAWYANGGGAELFESNILNRSDPSRLPFSFDIRITVDRWISLICVNAVHELRIIDAVQAPDQDIGWTVKSRTFYSSGSMRFGLTGVMSRWE